MTRREGTSKSNILCAMGGFTPKVGWTQMYGWHPKIDHSLSFSRFFFDLKEAVCTIFLWRTRLEHSEVPGNLFSRFFWDQGPAWRPDVLQTAILQGFFKKSTFTRSTIRIIPHEEASGMIRIAYMQGTNTWTFRRAGGTFSTSPPPREPWLTVYRGQQVIAKRVQKHSSIYSTRKKV